MEAQHVETLLLLEIARETEYPKPRLSKLAGLLLLCCLVLDKTKQAGVQIVLPFKNTVLLPSNAIR